VASELGFDTGGARTPPDHAQRPHQIVIGRKGSVALSGAACPGRSGTPAITLPRIPSMTTARAFRGFASRPR
jgi:hypothetical protein